MPAAQDRADPPEPGSGRHRQPALDANAGADTTSPCRPPSSISSAGSPITTSSSTTRRSPISTRPSASIPPIASGYVGRGAAYLNKDELHRAIADFSEALRLSPGQAFAHLQRGIAYHRIGEPDKALEDYSEAIKLTPKDPTPYVNRGIVYYTKKGQYEAAINDFTRRCSSIRRR